MVKELKARVHLLIGKFKTLNDDYSKYKSVVKSVVDEEVYNEIVRRLRSGN